MTTLTKCRDCLKFFKPKRENQMVCEEHLIKPKQSLVGIPWRSMSDYIKQCKKTRKRMNE